MWVGAAEGSLGNHTGIHNKRNPLLIRVRFRGHKATLLPCLTRKNVLTLRPSLGMEKALASSSGKEGLYPMRKDADPIRESISFMSSFKFLL